MRGTRSWLTFSAAYRESWKPLQELSAQRELSSPLSSSRSPPPMEVRLTLLPWRRYIHLTLLLVQLGLPEGTNTHTHTWTLLHLHPLDLPGSVFTPFTLMHVTWWWQHHAVEQGRWMGLVGALCVPQVYHQDLHLK